MFALSLLSWYPHCWAVVQEKGEQQTLGYPVLVYSMDPRAWGWGVHMPLYMVKQDHWTAVRDSRASPDSMRWIQGSPPEDHSAGEC